MIASVSFDLLLCASPARRLGAHLEQVRRNEIAAAARIAEALLETRGAFYGGATDLALDAKGRLLVGGWEDEGRWLGILRFRANGAIDEGFLRAVSQNFENDSVVGAVNQVLPLDDGHILAVGYFRKPQTSRARADDPGGIPFVLLDESGSVDEQWLGELRRQWPPAIAAVSPVLVESNREVTFLAQQALYTLSLGPPPRLGERVLLGDRRPQAICSLSDSQLVMLVPPRLEVVRRGGSRTNGRAAGRHDVRWGLAVALLWPGGSRTRGLRAHGARMGRRKVLRSPRNARGPDPRRRGGRG